MQQYRGTPYAADLATVFGKVAAQLGDEVTIDLNHLADSISVRGPNTEAGDERRFRELVRAVRERRQLELVYWTASRDEVCRRVVDPYHLASVHGDWFLVAHCHLREDIRMFAPARIRSLRETGERFERPADFRIGEYLDASFRSMRGDASPQRVRLRFTGEAARYVKLREWHPSQKIKKLRDGSLDVRLTVSHLLEVRRWVMGYGPECEVLEPAELREQVREQFRRGTEVYGEGES
jgi:predicted DNA-binding transcriptional regulator YafY